MRFAQMLMGAKAVVTTVSWMTTLHHGDKAVLHCLAQIVKIANVYDFSAKREREVL